MMPEAAPSKPETEAETDTKTELEPTLNSGGFNEARYGEVRFEAERYENDDRIRKVLALSKKHFKPGAKLLDVGCTDGFVSELFKRIGFHVTGVDASPSAVEAAKKRCDEAFVIDVSAKRLPIADASFDCIWAGEVIEHVFYTEDFVEDMRRLLKPGGYLILSTPNLACWINRISLVMGWQPLFTEIGARASTTGSPIRQIGMPAGHIRVFTAQALEYLLKGCGFTSVRISGASVITKASIKPMDKWLGNLFPSLASDLIAICRK